MQSDTATVTLAQLDGRLFATVPEVAAVLRCDVRTVRRSCAEGTIPYTKTGVTYRVPTAWLREQARVAAEPSVAGP